MKLAQLVSHAGKLWGLTMDGQVVVAEVDHNPQIPELRWVPVRTVSGEDVPAARFDRVASARLPGRSHVVIPGGQRE